MRQSLSGDGCPAALPARTAPTGRGGEESPAGPGRPAGRPAAPQCAIVPGRRRSGQALPGDPKIGRLLRRRNRDVLMASSLNRPPS